MSTFPRGKIKERSDHSVFDHCTAAEGTAPALCGVRGTGQPRYHYGCNHASASGNP